MINQPLQYAPIEELVERKRELEDLLKFATPDDVRLAYEILLAMYGWRSGNSASETDEAKRMKRLRVEGCFDAWRKLTRSGLQKAVSDILSGEVSTFKGKSMPTSDLVCRLAREAVKDKWSELTAVRNELKRREEETARAAAMKERGTLENRRAHVEASRKLWDPSFSQDVIL